MDYITDTAVFEFSTGTGRISDRMYERRWNLFIACVFSTVGLVIASMTMGSWWALVGMSIAATGFYGSKGPFFALRMLR